MATGTAEDGAGLPYMLAGTAALLCAGMAILFWPGIISYDAITQYAQALSGQYDDWHPPIMARLWAGLEAIGLPGSGPMLLFQLILFWSGLALVGMGLVRSAPRSGARRAGVAVLLVGLFPIVADWMLVIVKDSQLIAALVAATGIMVWFRLRTQRVPGWAVALVVLLLGYAVLVRVNSVFAVVPLAWSWQGWAGVRRWWARAALMLASVGLVLGVSGPINHGLLGATRSGVQATLPVFDVAGIAHYAGLQTVPGIGRADWKVAADRACYTPFYWDSFADYSKCGTLGDELTDPDLAPPLMHSWISLILAHPLAYTEHRLFHLNANLRVLVPAFEPSAAGPRGSDANPHNLGIGKTPAIMALTDGTLWLVRTPLGSPFAWLILAAALGWALLGTPPQPAREAGLALTLSALLMTASFAVVSIACDLRYHLWLIVSTLLASAMTAACEGVPRSRLVVGGATVVVVCGIEILARATLVTLPM